jgi:hypothetical protein
MKEFSLDLDNMKLSLSLLLLLLWLSFLLDSKAHTHHAMRTRSLLDSWMEEQL